MTIGAVVTMSDSGSGSDAFAGVPRGAFIAWTMPDSSNSVSDYFDLATGLGIAGTEVEGWAIVDGRNGDANATDRYIRGYGESGESVNQLLDQKTALPSSAFTTGNKTVTVNGSATMNDKNIDPNNRYLFYHTSLWESDSGSGIGSGTSYKYPHLTSDSKTITSSNLGHNHTITFNGTTANLGGQIASVGGDSETRPNTLVVLFITYVG